MSTSPSRGWRAPQPGWQPPPTPKRRRTRLIIGALAAVAVVAGVGRALGDDTSGERTAGGAATLAERSDAGGFVTTTVTTEAVAAPTPLPVATAPTVTVPPETVPPETVPPETVPPETTPPPTVPPETTPPPTVPPETTPPETAAPATMPPETSPPTTAPGNAPQLVSNCSPHYSGCVPIDSDVDCAGGEGNGPSYTGRVEVIGEDVYDLDRDGDRVACE